MKKVAGTPSTHAVPACHLSQPCLLPIPGQSAAVGASSFNGYLNRSSTAAVGAVRRAGGGGASAGVLGLLAQCTARNQETAPLFNQVPPLLCWYTCTRVQPLPCTR